MNDCDDDKAEIEGRIYRGAVTCSRCEGEGCTGCYGTGCIDPKEPIRVIAGPDRIESYAARYASGMSLWNPLDLTETIYRSGVEEDAGFMFVVESYCPWCGGTWIHDMKTHQERCPHCHEAIELDDDEECSIT